MQLFICPELRDTYVRSIRCKIDLIEILIMILFGGFCDGVQAIYVHRLDICAAYY